MKKVISGALAAAIITSNLPLRVLAEEVNPIVDSTDSKEENAVERTGYIEVDINLDMPIENNNDSEIAVQLNDSNSIKEIKLGGNTSGTFTYDGNNCSYTVEALDSTRKGAATENIYAYRVTFKDLPAGADRNYSVKISGNGFSEVESEKVNLNQYSKRIVVNNLIPKDSKEEGLIPFGDVANNDGLVNDDDYKAVFDSIGKENSHYDLNRDGKVDIADLQYVHNNLEAKAIKPVIKDAEWIPNLDNVTITSPDESVTEEDLKSVLDGNSESSVSIKPEKENVAISEDNSVNLSLDLKEKDQNVDSTPVKMQYLSILGNLKSGSIVLEDESGVSHTYDFGNGTSTDNENTPNGDAEIARNSTRSQNENLVIDLKGEIAVTKITINVTGVSDDDRNLAKIAKVEFLNDVYKEIPKPEMTVPEITGIATSTSTGNEHIELTWSKTLNITGYELKVEEIDEEGNVKGDAKTFRMSENSFKISNVKPYSRYRLSVQSINGEWLGGYGTNIAEKNVIENVDVNNNYKPLSDEVFKKNGEDGVVNVMVIPNEVPKYPEGIKAEGNYKSINLSWKTHNSARSFNVYYREKGIGDFVKANTNPITSNSYNITGLKDDTTYEIKLDATNHLGTGEKSPTVLATTVDMSIPKTPKYKLINTDQEDGSIKTNHIEKVEYPESKTATVTKSNEYAVVDNNYYSYWGVNISDAGIGGTAENLGPKVSFDKTYTIDKVAVVSKLDGTGMTTDFAEIIVYNADDKVVKEYVPSFTNYTNNGVYTMLKLGTPITLSKGQKIQVNLRAKSGNVSITELKFYEYDDIEEKINELFDGELYVKLKDTVTNEQIAELEKRIEETDNGEYHPDKKELQKKIVRARRLFEDKELNDEITDLDIMINPGGTNTGYGNDWQALGLAAKAGETIKVYLSRDIDDNAINRDVYLGYEQNYAESGSAISQQIKLKPGENTIKIDKLFDYDVEKGGNLYVRMSGIPDSKGTKIRIRVSGAEKIPHLNLNDKLVDVDYLVEKKSENTDEKVKAVKDSLKKYILELKDHVENIETLHNASNEKHKNDDNFKNNIYKYDEKTSVLNSTNIEGDRFTLTIPATQVYKSLGLSGVSKNATDDTVEDATLNARVDKMYDSMLAWEQLIQITNAKKGVLEKDNGSGLYANNKASRQRVNVKYQRMFGGAFMYASSHHVGVEFGSTADFMKGVPYQFNDDGTVKNKGKGYLFGWGISHEIGHKADIAKRTYGETSNNILALITQTFDGVSESRLEMNEVYPKIYKKVTSNSVGASQDVATLLGMFWQLHLAYEPGYTSQMLKNNNDSDKNNDSYYAKMNRLYRNLTDTEQKLDKDQLLIRKASEAAGRDLRQFFASWGLISDENTDVYLQQKFSENERETRKIQYLNDEAYRRRLAGTADMESGTVVEASFDNVTAGNKVQGSSVTLNLNVNQSKDKILGYEIIRSDGNYNDNGVTKVKYRPVGFVNAKEDGSATFTDDVAPMNNRAFTYKVVAYDYNLKATEEVTLGTVKLSHDGTIKSNDFVIKSNMISTVGKTEGSNGESTVNENTTEDNSLDNIKDGDKATAFRGRRMTSDEYTKNPHKQEGININEDPYIIMDLQGTKDVTGIKYTKSSSAVSRFSLKRLFNRSTTYSPMSKYEIYVSNDGETWESVSTGTFEFGNESILGGATDADTAKVLFTKNNNLYSYDARYVKIVAKDAGDSNLDIADISLIGSTGDNIEIGAVNIENNQISTGIGRLEEDFVYDKKGSKIPAGSILVVGKYKGNPAFNVPLLIDENNKTIEGEALLMAKVDENAELGSVAEGTWMYWISKENFDKLSKNVKAELYRYNELEEDGKTPIGQRLVSDTLYVNVNAENYESLPIITLKNQGSLDTEDSTKRKISKAKSNELAIKYIDTNDFERKED